MATLRWLGVAQDLPQIDDHTFANTYATGDTVEVEINKKTLILTLGTDVTLADVAAETAAMINAANATAGRLNTADETRNFGGQEIAEFTEIVASASGAVLRTKSTAGVPVTITVSVTTAGSGSVSSSNIQAATGKNFFNNADNWSGGSLPSAADIILFDQGAVSVKYGLENTGGGQINNLNLGRLNSYTGNIGLPATNPLGYVEYRNRFLHLPSDGTAQALQIGDVDSTLSPTGYTYIDYGTTSATNININVLDAPDLSESGGRSVHIVGGDNIIFMANSGGIHIGADWTLDATKLNSVTVNGDANVLLDELTQLEANSTIIQTDGVLKVLSSVAGTQNPTYVGYGGSAHLQGVHLLSAIIHDGASLVYQSQVAGVFPVALAVLTTATIYGGGSLSEGDNPATITNMTIYRGATLYHPKDKFIITNGIDFSGCRPSEITWTAPLHKTWTPSAI